MTITPFVFLDRDGTLVRHIPYLCDPAQIELLPTVREGLVRLIDEGCRLFLHTNQSGVGRGYFTLEQAQACNDRMIELMGLGNNIFEDICIAVEKPDAPQIYRKPSPRFAQEVLHRYGGDIRKMYYIGDSPSDILTATRIGGIGLGVQTGEAKLRNAFGPPPQPSSVIIFDTFAEAADHIIAKHAYAR